MSTDKKLDEILDAVNTGFTGIQNQFDKVNKRFNTLEKGQENLELKMSNVAYRFELQDLQARVEKLEEKMEGKK